MQEKENFNLKDVEILDDSALKMTSNYSGGYGTGPEDCMSESFYYSLLDAGVSVSGVYVCNLGWILNEAVIEGSGRSGSDDYWGSWDEFGSGSYDPDHNSSGGGGSTSGPGGNGGNQNGGSNNSGGSNPPSKWVGFTNSGNRWIGDVDWRLRTTMNEKIDACNGKSKGSTCDYGYGAGTCQGYNFGNSLENKLKCLLKVQEHEACAGKEWSNKCSYEKPHTRSDGWCSSFAFGSYKGYYCSPEKPHT